MASLLTLPLELLVAVSGHLSTPDLCALRVTCKQVEKSLYEWFSTEFFKKKQFMLSHNSLQTFIDISKHVGFSKKLTYVIIATNVYVDVPMRFRDEDAAIKYIEGFDDQKALISTGIDREMLTEAFRGLPNLQVVGIRDFNANNRTRDGQAATWSSWGAPTAYHDTGIPLSFTTHTHVSETGIGFTARIFQNVVYALSKAGRTPAEIEVLLRRHPLPDSAFHIPKFLEPTFEPILLNLKTLLLSVDTNPKLLHTHTNGTAIDTIAGRLLRKFLSRTPSLTFLRLNFQKYQVTHNESFLQWLSESDTSTTQTSSVLDPPPVKLPNLKQLELGQLDVQPHIVFEVIVKFAATLKSVSFWRMNLSNRSPNFATKPNFWANFFRELTKIPKLQLSSLKAGMLQQDTMHVSFKKPGSDDKTPSLNQREYNGPKMVAFLEELAEQSIVSWPVMDEVNSDDDSEFQDEEDPDDDDDDDDEAMDEDE